VFVLTGIVFALSFGVEFVYEGPESVLAFGLTALFAGEELALFLPTIMTFELLFELKPALFMLVLAGTIGLFAVFVCGRGFVVLGLVSLIGVVVAPSELESNSTASTSSAKKVICRAREPSPIETTNCPSRKLMILPLMTLPSFSRIVSANASAHKHKTRLNARVTRKNLDFKNILPPKDFKFSGLKGCRICDRTKRCFNETDFRESGF
jgi:hypothetical protein